MSESSIINPLCLRSSCTKLEKKEEIGFLRELKILWSSLADFFFSLVLGFFLPLSFVLLLVSVRPMFAPPISIRAKNLFASFQK
jgi:hypothetical protein